MSIFPTKILLATEGSEEAALAAETAADIARLSRSELHVVHVEGFSPYPLAAYSPSGYVDTEPCERS